MATDRERAQEIDDILRNVEPKLQRAFRDGLTSIKEEISISEIEDAIGRGDVDRAALLINDLIVGSALLQFNREIQSAVQAGGDLASRWASADKIVFGLNVTESNTARFINSYQANKVREITVSLQETIGEMVRIGVIEGKNPRLIAKEIRDSIGLTAKQQQAVNNFERLLRTQKSEALTRALRDKRFDRSIVRAINEKFDLTEDQIKRMTDRYKQRFINRRAETIARTEAIRLVSTGQNMFWQQAVNEGIVQREQVRRKWLPTYDGKLRDAHAAIPRMNEDGVGMDEPFQSPLGPIMFPGDPSASIANVANCRCAVLHRIRA